MAQAPLAHVTGLACSPILLLACDHSQQSISFAAILKIRQVNIPPRPRRYHNCPVLSDA